jgi:thymidylate synthase
MNNIDKTYQNLLKDIIMNGVEKDDRTGTGTISVFGREIRHDMKEGFPLLTTKKLHWKSIVVELLWFLRGDTNIQFLHDNNIHIWDGDYNKSGRKDGELGPIYGKQWRKWSDYYNGSCEHIDQIEDLLNNLKSNPDSRRLMVNAWNVAEINDMSLPPCHYGFQLYTRKLTPFERYHIWYPNNYEQGMEYNPNQVGEVDIDDPYFFPTPKRAISLIWNQRSVDTFLGLPFNIASYALLLKMIAREVNMVPDELIGHLGDVHLYKNHIEQAKLQISREPLQLSHVHFNGEKPDDLKDYKVDDIILTGYYSHPKIEAPLSN